MPVLAPLIHALFPPLCVHCRHEGAWLCPTAQTAIDRELCLINAVSIPYVDRVIVRGSYDTEALAQFIQSIKYRYWHGCEGILPDILQPIRPHLRSSRDVVIVPVPLHVRRQRERGFNQSMLIAQALGAITGWPVQQLLRRTRYTTPQAQLSAKQRMKNIIGAMNVKTSSTWPHHVILVDDVITTGSTIAECATVLNNHGVKYITAVALAKG
jgi:ComF family protein